MVANKTATVGALELLSKDVADVQRDQLRHGRNSLGDSITPNYKYYLVGEKETYADFKNEMNPLAGHGTPDLNLTGSFYASIRFHIEGSIINWEADDPNGLLSKYKSVLGIYKNDALILFQTRKLYPLMIQIIKAETGL